MGVEAAHGAPAVTALLKQLPVKAGFSNVRLMRSCVPMGGRRGRASFPGKLGFSWVSYE